MPTLRERLVEVLRRQFPAAQFDAAATGLALGSFPQWDSLGHFNFLMAVEEEFDTRFSLEEISELKSLDDIETALGPRG
ncbi:MAG TPA: acyl carrier protein [Stellaceae bacterium]|nr:acyl carrier protein [Stellaceae bacterium]